MADEGEIDGNTEEVKQELQTFFEVIVDYIFGQMNDNEFQDNAVREAIKNTSTLYTSQLGEAGGDRPDFSNTVTQWAYIYSYFIRHVHLVYTALWEFSKAFPDDESSILKTLDVKVCSLGGGPNTDSVGLRLYLKIHENVTTTSPFPEVHVLDLYDNWSNAWGTLGPLLPEVYRCQPTYHHFNFLDGITTDEALNTVENADLITMIKSLSSVAANNVQATVHHILEAMKPGALLLFVDNKCCEWEEIFVAADYLTTHEEIMRRDIHPAILCMNDIYHQHHQLKQRLGYYPTLTKGDNVMMLIRKK